MYFKIISCISHRYKEIYIIYNIFLYIDDIYTWICILPVNYKTMDIYLLGVIVSISNTASIITLALPKSDNNKIIISQHFPV